MKKPIIALLIAATLLAFGCNQKKTSWPMFGQVIGRTYTCEEAQIKINVPEGFTPWTHATMTEKLNLAADYYDNLGEKTFYYEFRYQNNDGQFQLNFEKKSAGLTALQAMNRLIANNKESSDGTNMIYSEVFDKTICGNTYSCAEYTMQGTTEKGFIAYRNVGDGVFAYMSVWAMSDEVYEQMNGGFVEDAFPKTAS